MKSKWSLLGAIMIAGLGALTTGCYASTGYVTTETYTYDYDDGYTQPTLVAAGPNVWIVEGQPSVYYADNVYWRYYGNGWYRSPYSNRGWVSVNAAPVIVVDHYHSANVRRYPTTHRTPARPTVYTGQTVRVPHSRPSVSVHASGSGRVVARPSVKKPHVVHRKAKPSVRNSRHSSSKHSSSSHSRSHGR